MFLCTTRMCSNLMRTFPVRMMSSDSSQEVLFQVIDRKGVVTMNRPKALNALSLPMIRLMYPEISKWNKEKSVDMVLLKACPGKAFCAGGDVKAIAAARGSNTAFFREEYELDHLLATMSAYQVSLINGIVMGGGCGVSFHGMFKVATENTLFAMPETAIGLFPDVGACHFLARMKSNLGVFFGLTGNRLKGADLLHVGLVSHYVPSKNIEALEKDLLALKNVSEASIRSTLEKHQSLDIGKFSLENELTAIEECFGKNTLEEIMECLKTKGDFGAKQLALLNKMSPLSMKVTLKAIQKSKKLNLAEVLKMDMRLGTRFLNDNDFYEGVDALLVRKTNDPKWQPDSVEKVTDKMVEDYFKKLPDDEELKL